MSCDAQPSLFDDLEVPEKPHGRRKPPRHAAERQDAVNLRLPIFSPEESELRALEDLALQQRPVTRGDCEEEARPCPWVRCPKHLYFDRFLEFEEIIDAIDEVSEAEDWAVLQAVAEALIGKFRPAPPDDDPDGKAKRPRTKEALRDAVRGGRAMVTSYKRGSLRADVLSSPHVRGPWPTCSLDVAEDVKNADAELEQEDTGRANGLTREAVRLIERRVLPSFAGEESLRPWLEELVGEERLDELSMSGVDWFGGD